MKPPTLGQLAERITAHLKRMEADPQVNVSGPRLRPFHQPAAWAAGAKVAVVYQGWHVHSPEHLSKAQAQAYLDWLDAGNSGTHFAVNAQEAP